MNKFFIIIISLCFAQLAQAIDVSHSINLFTELDEVLILNYKPTIYHAWEINNSDLIDINFIPDFTFTGRINNFSLKIKSYRQWIRYSQPKLAIRLGQQKINFGQCRYLRPLRWFDTIDPLDISGDSAGVTALLTKYYWDNNSTLWFWLIAGNDTIKGNESISSDSNIEPGFRYQIPISNFEFALSAHHRKLSNNEAETKFGLDFYTDYILGWWGEYQLQTVESKTEQELCLGADYTLPYFAGLHLLVEEQIFFEDLDNSLTATSLDFPITIFDSMILVYQRDLHNNFYSYTINWSRAYDRFSFYLSLSNYKISDKTDNKTAISLAYDF